MQISLVIPLLNESESLPELASWIEEVMKKNKYTYEIIFIDDGSKDNSWEVIQNLRENNQNVKAIRFQRNYGKSAALNMGFEMAKGDVIITMDADLQDSPDEIPELYELIALQDFDLVSGWKKVRYDNALTKNIPSKFYNSVTSYMSGINLHDFNCGLKAYKNQVVKSIEVYGEMHRYIPVIAKKAGFDNITEKTVQHRARKYGVSKFGWERFINGMLDLISIMFVGKFRKKPMHFFGSIGFIMFFLGFIISLYLIFAKFAWKEYHMTERPLFYFALLFILLGSQFFLTGFLAELISRNDPDRNTYLVSEVIN